MIQKNIFISYQFQFLFKILLNKINKLYEKFCDKYDLDEINPKKQYGNSQVTFAMYLAEKGIAAPKAYQHNVDLKNKRGQTVEDILKEKDIEVPSFWKNQKHNQDKIVTNKDEVSTGHSNSIKIATPQPASKEPTVQIKQVTFSPQVQQIVNFYCNKYNVTIEQILKNPAYNSNQDKMTCAMQLAGAGLVPPPLLEHDPLIQNTLSMTVGIFLSTQNVPVPQRWQYPSETILNKYGHTSAMIIASIDDVKTIQQCWWHQPQLQDQDKNTVAMYLASRGINPPQQWRHKPELQNNKGNTVAMILASQGIIPPQEWQHDPDLGNNSGFHVEAILFVHFKSLEKVPMRWRTKRNYQQYDKKEQQQQQVQKQQTTKVQDTYTVSANSQTVDCYDVVCGCQPPDFNCCGCICGCVNVLAVGCGLELGSCCGCYGCSRSDCCTVCIAGCFQQCFAPCLFGFISSCIVGFKMMCCP